MFPSRGEWKKGKEHAKRNEYYLKVIPFFIVVIRNLLFQNPYYPSQGQTLAELTKLLVANCINDYAISQH